MLAQSIELETSNLHPPPGGWHWLGVRSSELAVLQVGRSNMAEEERLIVIAFGRFQPLRVVDGFIGLRLDRSASLALMASAWR